jgi:thioester reductase-like protein
MGNKYSNLLELFIEIAGKYPAGPAIKDSTRSLTYLELYQHAAVAADLLLHNGIKPGDRVVCVSKKDNRSIICFWAVLLAGAIPAMLDNEDGMQTNCRKAAAVNPAAIILESRKQYAQSCLAPVKVLEFNELLATAAPGRLPEKPAAMDAFPDTCYILLTSGTSGSPKAVQVSHSNVLHYTYAVYDRIGKPEAVRAAHVTTFAADLGLTNLLVALISGGMLRILNKTESTDPALFSSIIDDDSISLLKVTPSHLVSLISGQRRPYKVPVANIIVGGEKLSWQLVKNIFSLNVCNNLYNHYGPTETTVGATVFKVDSFSPHFDVTASVPIGTALGRGFCFIENVVDDTGELYISGPGVSKGYMGTAGSNSGKFVIKEINGKSVVCYRTGDMCRLLNDGNFEFLYRNDRQVKVKGHRIELGEIELAVSAHPDVENAIASVSASNDHQVLEVYIKLIEHKEPGVATLRSWMLEKLPAYKVPSAFYIYNDVPYNANGKIDMEALKTMCKKPQAAAQQESMVTKDNPWAVLAESTWQKVLGKETISLSDNFFEGGGDSLLAIQLIGRLQRYGYDIHITDLNTHPAFEDFIRLNPVQVSADSRAPQGKKPASKFTCSQQIFLQQDKFSLNEYCQTILLETEGTIRVKEMALAINSVLQSHSQLSSAFRKKDGVFTVEKRQHTGLVLGTTILDTQMSAAGQIQETCSGLLKEISLDKGRLFAAHIFADGAGKDYLYLAFHHLVVDVISWNIIIDELLDYYEQILKGEQPVVKEEDTVSHFFAALEDAAADFTRPAASFDEALHLLPASAVCSEQPDLAEVYSITVPAEISLALQNSDNQQESSSVSGFLLNAFAGAVMMEYDMENLSVDLEFHGRPQHDALPDLSRSVAWWATTMTMNLQFGKLDPHYCTSLIDAKAEVANGINLNAGQFQPAARPDIRFNYLGHFPEQFGNAAICMKPSVFHTGQSRSKNALQEYAIFFTARYLGHELIIDIQYQLKKCCKPDMDNIIRNFIHRLKQCARIESAATGNLQLLALQGNIPTVGLPLFNAASMHGNIYRLKNSVLLTGATGFLGIHLLRELVKYSNSFIYCLVRAENQLHAEERLRDCIAYYFGSFPDEWHDRIKVVQGNLNKDNLGICKEEYDSIANRADIILHAAADINLFKNYAELQQANITATKNIIELAGYGRSKKVHYVSTLAVSGYVKGGKQRSFCEEDFDQGQQFVSGYEKSKFEAEKIIREFIADRKEGKIYRVSHIAADSVYGKFQQNMEQNRIFQVIKGMMLVKQVPVEYKEKVSFSYVDIAARGIANLCLGITATASNCLHIENAQYLTFFKIASMLRQMGYKIEEVEMDRFSNAVACFEGTKSDKRIVELMSSWIQRSIDYPRQVNFVQKNSLDAIAGSGVYFPKTDFKWFARLVEEGIKAGYFYAPESDMYMETYNTASAGSLFI